MKEYVKEHKDSILVIAIFIIFAIFLIFQHQFLYLYHDDYGYASLSYVGGAPENIHGTDFTFSDIINFLQKHYLNWGGRVLSFFVEVAGLHYLGLNGFRILQAITILGIFFLIYLIMSKVLDKKVKKWIIALVTVALYGITEYRAFADGVFWITASVLYVCPIFFLLSFVYLYSFKKDMNNEGRFKKFIYVVLLGVTIFIATFSQEQIAVASFMYILVWTCYNIIKNKKLSKLDIFLTIISGIGFAILMLAPGNEIRKQAPSSATFYQMPFLQRTGKGIAETIIGNFSEYNKIFQFFFFGTALLFGIKNLQKNTGFKALNILNLISTSEIFLITFIRKEGYFNYAYNIFDNLIYKIGVTLIALIQLGLIAYSITIYLWNRGTKSLAILFWCAIFSQGAMIVAPYFPVRSSIIFEYLYNLIGIVIIGDIYSESNNKIITSCLIIPFLVLCIFNSAKITKGYKDNSFANEENNQKLEIVSEKIKAGENITNITLKKLPNIMYSGAQPYQENCDYILWWIKAYYDLPLTGIDIQYE